MNLEKNVKRFSDWLTLLAKTGVSILKILVRLNVRSICSFPEISSTKCIILGNGPSLKESISKYSNELKKTPLVCVNGFVVTDIFEELKPTYYVILDPQYWADVPHVIIQDIFNKLNEKVSWDMNLLVPTIARKSKQLNLLQKKNKHIKVHYFNYTVFNGFTGLAHFFFKKNMAAPQCQNVIVASLFLSINIGFKDIYLLGADHTWHQNLHVNEKNQLCLKDVHFYDNQETITYLPYYTDEQETKVFKMHEILTLWSKTFYGYEVIKNYGLSRKASIYNASEISFIDSLERKTIS